MVTKLPVITVLDQKLARNRTAVIILMALRWSISSGKFHLHHDGEHYSVKLVPHFNMELCGVSIVASLYWFNYKRHPSEERTLLCNCSLPWSDLTIKDIYMKLHTVV